MATVTPKTLYRLNAQKLQLLGLVDDTGAVVNTATVLATMTDQGGNALTELNGVTLAIADSNGDYSYTIPATFSPPNGNYVCVITASVGGVLKLTINQPITVADRTS
jgi:hypothetical protein